MHRLKIFFLIILFQAYLNAQQKTEGVSLGNVGNRYSVESLTVTDGLYENNIQDILQDRYGFLWLAGMAGLQKYDGYSYTYYKPDSLNPAWQDAEGLFEDSAGNLWVQMKEGLIRYRRELDDFVKYYFINRRNDTIPYKVVAMAEDTDERLWVWFQNKGLFRINTENKTFIGHKKINDWYSTINKPVILNETSRRGIYKISLTFPAAYCGRVLQYRFSIKRKSGSLETESIINPDYPGNRTLVLTGDSLILPAASFIKNMKVEQKNVKSYIESESRPTLVEFTIDLNDIKNHLVQGDEVWLQGSLQPLYWGNNLLIQGMAFDSTNALWIGLGYVPGVMRFNLETGDHKNFISDPRIKGTINSNHLSTAVRDENNILWLGTRSGISRYDDDKNAFENYLVNPANPWDTRNNVVGMADDGQGHIWLAGSDEGVDVFNKRTKEFIHFFYQRIAGGCNSVAIDRSGIIWFGKWYSGIIKLDTDDKKFFTFTIKEGDHDLLEGKEPQAVLKDQDGDIWIGGNEVGGLFRYNPQNGNYRIYRLNKAREDSLDSNFISEIIQDSKDILWIGTRSGLIRFDKQKVRFKHILTAVSIQRIVSQANTILEGDDGILWLATVNGYLVRFNPKSEEMRFYSIPDKQMSFRTAVMDPKGFIWIGTFQGGLIKFDIVTKKLSAIETVSNQYISALCMDGDSILWCTSNSDGLIRYNTSTNIKSVINETDGLLSNGLVGMEQDDAGNLWLSSHRGLTRYNPRTHTFKNYFKEDGFLTNEFIYRGHFKDKDGTMVFSSSHGIVTFHPDSIKDSDYKPPLVLTGIKINNKSVKPGKNSPLKKNISISDEIILNHDQNDLSVSFASLDFSHPERNEYSFYLQGLEDSWHPSGRERTAYYTNLDPGEYIFQVKGTNSDGVWNEAGTSIKIIILAPWWETWWAYTMYICVFLGLLLFIRRYELNRQNLKHSWELERVETEKYQEIDRMKSRFFANISHEFRTPLTLIKGPVQQMLSGDFKGSIEKQYKMILRNTNRLMQLINQLLDLSKLDSGEMVLRASPEDIVSLVNGLTQSFESLAKQKNIELQYQSSVEEVVAYIDRDKFEKIIINLLSNAFKFTPEWGNISVNINVPSFESPDKSQLKKDSSLTFVEILVNNTGPGILPEQLDKIFNRFYQADDSSVRKYEGTGIGLALTKELVELHHGKIKVESEPGKETRFIVYLPLGKDHLQPEEIIEEPPDISSGPEANVDKIESEYFAGSEIKTVSNKSSNISATLLIVEDNPDMRSYMCESLESNYKIIQAENGEEGIRQSLEHFPDMIISDVMMPKMDGFQFCAEIKKDERTSHIPVILLTAKASGESRIEGLETGADDYLTKPFDIRELKVRINNLIELRKRLQEKFRKEFTVSPRDITVTSIDEQLVQRAIAAVEKNISNPEFDTSGMAKEVGISRMLLNTKLKALTGLPTGEFIRTLRLKRAAQLLRQDYGNVTQVAYEVGFQSLSYFAKAFREQYGQSPSHYLLNNKND